jgi:hypothetical protein
MPHGIFGAGKSTKEKIRKKLIENYNENDEKSLNDSKKFYKNKKDRKEFVWQV